MTPFWTGFLGGVAAVFVFSLAVLGIIAILPDRPADDTPHTDDEL